MQKCTFFVTFSPSPFGSFFHPPLWTLFLIQCISVVFVGMERLLLVIENPFMIGLFVSHQRLGAKLKITKLYEKS